MDRGAPALSRTWRIVAVIFLVIAVAALPPSTRDLLTALLRLGPVAATGEVRLLAQVRQGSPVTLGPTTLAGPRRITGMGMQEARAPESAELDPSPWEGQFLLLEGRDSGDWLYSARVVRALTPLEATLARWAWPTAVATQAP